MFDVTHLPTGIQVNTAQLPNMGAALSAGRQFGQPGEYAVLDASGSVVVIFQI